MKYIIERWENWVSNPRHSACSVDFIIIQGSQIRPTRSNQNVSIRERERIDKWFNAHFYTFHDMQLKMRISALTSTRTQIHPNISAMNSTRRYVKHSCEGFHSNLLVGTGRNLRNMNLKFVWRITYTISHVQSIATLLAWMYDNNWPFIINLWLYHFTFP